MKAKSWTKASYKERIERWENVLRVLRDLSRHEREKHWDMSTWAQKTECGTIACAAGHCAMDTWFKRRGFKQEFHPSLWSAGLFSDLTHCKVSDFFGYHGAETIFYNGDRRPVGQVIKEVKRHIKQLKADYEIA